MVLYVYRIVWNREGVYLCGTAEGGQKLNKINSKGVSNQQRRSQNHSLAYIQKLSDISCMYGPFICFEALFGLRFSHRIRPQSTSNDYSSHACLPTCGSSGSVVPVHTQKELQKRVKKQNFHCFAVELHRKMVFFSSNGFSFRSLLLFLNCAKMFLHVVVEQNRILLEAT